MRRALICSISALGLAFAGNAAADSKKLKGEYGFTGSADCINSRVGFTLLFQAMDGPDSNSISFSVEGIRTFNGDGACSVKGTAVAILPRPTYAAGFPPNASGSNFTFDCTYTVDGEGGWTSEMVPGTFLNTFFAGPRTGQTSTVDAIPKITGMISKGGKTLIAAHTTPAVETHTFTGAPAVVEYRVCHRSRVLIKLGKDKDND